MATELAIIELRLEGEEGVRAALERIDELKESAEGRTEIRLDTANAQKRLLELTAKMNEYRKTMENADKDSDAFQKAAKGLKDTKQEARSVQLAYKILSKALKEIVRDEKEVQKAHEQAAKAAEKQAKAEERAAKEAERASQRAAKEAERATKEKERQAAAAQKAAEAEARANSFIATFNRTSSKVAHVGSAFQSLGNALTQLTSPFRQLTNGIAMGAGYKMLNKFTEGLSSGFARSDTMRKYVRLMSEYETANYTAEQSRKELDESVQGLPIALDDAVSLAQRYTLSLGDMERGTKLAIATNNAFLASMATENQRYQGMLQMQDLLNGKELNSREWMSLGASMGKAINEIGKEFGYTNENMGEFRQKLYAGEIGTQDFLNALQKVGTGNGSLVELAKQSMDTWEAFFSRIGTAASRLTYGALTSLDEVVTTITHGKFKSLNSLLDDRIIPGIDRMTESVKGWIKAHPQELADFFRQLSSINWSSLLTGMAQGLKAQAEILTFFAKLANDIGGGSLAWVTRWGIYLNMAGKAFTIFGGMLKGTRHIWGGLWALLRTKIKGGIIGGLFGKLFGKKIPTKEIAEAPKAIDTLRGVVKSLSGIAKLAGGIGITALTAWGSVKAVKSIIRDLKVIGEEMEGVDWKNAGIAMGGFAGFCTAFGLVGKALNKAKVGWEALKGVAIAGAFTTFIAFVTSADFQLLATGAKAFNSMTKNIKKAFENIDAIGDISGKAGKVKSVAEGLVKIYQAFGGNKKDEGFNEIKPSKVQNFSKIAKDMNTTLATLGEISTKLKGLSKKELPTEDEMTKVSDSLKPVLEGLGNMIYNAPKVLKNNESGNLSQYLSDSFKGLSSAIDMLLGKKGILAKLPKLAKGIARLQGLKVLETLSEEGGQFDQLGSALDAMINSLNLKGFNTDEFAADISNILTGITDIQSILEQLKAIGSETIDTKGTDNIKKAIDNIKTAFDDAHANELSGQVMVFVTAIEAALQEFEKFNEPIEITPTIKLGKGFETSVNKAVRQINGGKKDIEGAMNRVPSTITKNITAHFAVNVVVSGLSGATGKVYDAVNAKKNQLINSLRGSGAIPDSTGGLFSGHGILYRSGGGSIFKPRGTDKIPAMLTQGEYVHRKQAVDYFGTDFMQKVNAMDVRGAMNALLTKAGSSTNIGRQSIINNTVNNNQRVTQNISTNNPNFTRVQMGRFAGAL